MKWNLIMLINVQYLFHTLSQILNQNDNNELIKNLSHILDQINNSKIYVIISVKTNFAQMKFNHVNQCTILILYSVTNFEPKWQQWID